VQGPCITVVGSSNTDLTIITEHLPVPGETILGGELLQAGGGKGANQAVAAARAGARVAFIGKIGDDDFGRAALEALRREGINTDGVAVDEQSASGVALIIVDKDGENMIAVAPGANGRLSAGDVDAAGDLIRGADLLLLQLEIPLEAVRSAARLAREAGVAVLLNPAPAPPDPLPDELLRMTDCITPNAVEAAGILRAPVDGEPEQMAQRLVRAGARAAVLTLGPEGACICEGATCRRIVAPKVRAVDTTAAGDCFCGALAVALGEGRPLPEAARFAACAAALCVQKAGAQPSLPHRAEINALLEKQNST